MGRSSNVEDIQTGKFWWALVAEFVGTGLLVAVACGACYSSASILHISLAFGLSVGTIVWSIAHVSGGHINPAVTIAFLFTRKISIVRALFYVISQCLGAIAGAGLLWIVTPRPSEGVNVTVTNPTLGTSGPAGDGSVSPWQTLIIEAVITFVLVFTVFATCDQRRIGFNGSGPLAIGLSVTMGHLWAVPFTGAGTNPARVFGPAVISHTWTIHWAYWLGPIVGGIAAGLLYDLIFAVNASRYKLAGFFSSDYDDDNYEDEGQGRSSRSKINREVDDRELSSKLST